MKDSDIPILGINTKTHYFQCLADQLKKQFDDAKTLKLMKVKNYLIKHIKELFSDKNFALNEVAVLKKDTSSMIKIDAFV